MRDISDITHLFLSQYCVDTHTYVNTMYNTMILDLIAANEVA